MKCKFCNSELIKIRRFAICKNCLNSNILVSYYNNLITFYGESNGKIYYVFLYEQYNETVIITNFNCDFRHRIVLNQIIDINPINLYDKINKIMTFY
jgi:hypothetical protein